MRPLVTQSLSRFTEAVGNAAALRAAFARRRLTLTGARSER